MTNVLKSLKILSFEDLYAYTEISFLDSIKNNPITLEILNQLYFNISSTKKNSQSFAKDIKMLENRFNLDLELIVASPTRLKK